MNILINLLSFSENHLYGVGMYFRDIFAKNSKEIIESTDSSLTIIYNEKISPKIIFEIPDDINIKYLPVKCIGNKWVRVLYEQLVLPFRCVKYDIIYSPNNINPIFLPKQTRSLITIHDLLPFKPSNRFSFVQRLYLTQLTKLCAHRARKILTVSNSSKEDIINTLGVGADKVEVTYNITNKPILNEKSCDIDFPRNYFFSIGALQKDKQYDVIIRGFYLFLTKMKKDYKLLIAGGDQGHKNELESLVLELGLSNQVVFLGYIDESDKWIYIKNCIATILMGKNEGFGIPVIESILLHKPAIVANLGALPEIVGKSGYVIESNKESVAETFELCTSINTCIESEVFDSEIKRFQLSEQLNILIHALKCSLK